MIQELTIQNIALISELSLSFEKGFNVLTGETGAGKSILVDSMNLILGSRGDRELIQHGKEKAYVEAQITEYEKKDVLSELDSYGIDAGESLILSRELSVSGKNVCRINGRLVSLNMLREIAGRLIHLYGQNQQQDLFAEKYHLRILDQYGGESIIAAKETLGDAFRKYSAVQKKLDALRQNAAEKERRLDMLRFQIDEISKADLKIGEEESLEQEKRRMLNSEKIASALELSKELLNGNESVLEKLKETIHAMEGIGDMDERYAKVLQSINDAYYSLEDSYYEISDCAESVAFEPARLEEIEDRLALVAGLRRKYGSSVEEILSFRDAAQEELEELEGSDSRIEELEQQVQELRAAVEQTARLLTKLRRKTAEILEKAIVGQLQELGMKYAQFSIRFKTKEYAADGADIVEFYITVNQGEPLKPLTKVASGGEASRIMLAIKNITAMREDISTMIFDEVDTGISGNMAQVVAQKIGRIAKERQVICVTHLAQIAAMADVHYYIEKQVSGGHTKTVVQRIDGENIPREIARLAGGIESELSLAHAKELLLKAKEYKRDF